MGWFGYGVGSVVLRRKGGPVGARRGWSAEWVRMRSAEWVPTRHGYRMRSAEWALENENAE